MVVKKDTEIDAMKAIQEALEHLDDAARIRAINWTIQKMAINVPQINTNPSVTLPSAGQIKPPLIKDFVSSKHPSNTYQRLACLAYYLEKYEGKPEFKAADLTDANTRARQPKITNITVYVNDTTAKYGFLTTATKGNKSLTPRGEALVDALPDTKAAEQALLDNPFGKKSSKTKKRK